MDRKYLTLLILVCFSILVFGEECVVYTFEDDFDDLFSNEKGVCQGMRMWQLGYYSSISLERPHPLSTTFISPEFLLSCVSSFTFPMSGLGTIEVNLYMDPVSNSDQISVVVHEVVPGSTATVVGNRGISAMAPDFEKGWHSIRIPLTGSGTFDGYVSLMGMAASGSVVLIDSFRYIPPLYDEELCVLYTESNHNCLIRRAGPQK
ncbi:hypothetical protein RR48_08108 [Papilio machaon]|uniref:MAM domain-containing protein n=1 Tax=Papilio machaon TaxID=76193 RepID=A0A194RFZ1_PAPMA|nr:hypothetical protein RR48_08108 [Papilio machaon]